MGIILGFERRRYRLGETIHLTVELVPRRDIQVREARVDLMRYTRHTEVTTVLVPPLPSRTPRLRAMNRMSMAANKHVSETYTDTDVHSSAVFVRDRRLSSGRATTCDVALEIAPEWPTQHSDGTRWRLVTTVDIAAARNIVARRLVSVAT